jgi:signal transduction histidine kinase
MPNKCPHIRDRPPAQVIQEQKNLKVTAEGEGFRPIARTMSLRSVRSLLLIAAAIVAAMVLVRVAGMVFTWQAMPDPQLPWLAWLEMGLGVAIVSYGAAAAWRVLRGQQEHEDRRVRRDHLAEVGAMASGLAHEMRNYLNAMHTHVALLRKAAGSDAEGCQKCGQRIQRLEETTGSLEELLADFLTFARPLQDRFEEINVEELIGEVVDFAELDMEQAGVELRVNVNPGLPPVYADRAKLKRAVLNLLVNARQAMPEGGTISVRAVADNDSVATEIADTGCGIPEEDQKRMFESFFSTKSEGVGLGLAIVKRTIEDMLGSISFESTVGQGTRFRIVLPSSVRSRKALEKPRGPISCEPQWAGTNGSSS